MTEAKPGEAPKADAKDVIQPLSVDPNRFIDILAEELKAVQQIKPPAWAPFVKTGMHKERPPVKKDWWYARTASILRSVAKLGPVGTSKLRTRYGGRHSRGFKSERFAAGSGSIIRKALQQLEKAGLIKQTAKGVHKGRVITQKASSLMNASAIKAVKEPAGAKAASASK